jgi:hypothetical protein
MFQVEANFGPSFSNSNKMVPFYGIYPFSTFADGIRLVFFQFSK